jgi:hypothetical protein
MKGRPVVYSVLWIALSVLLSWGSLMVFAQEDERAGGTLRLFSTQTMRPAALKWFQI